MNKLIALFTMLLGSLRGQPPEESAELPGEAINRQPEQTGAKGSRLSVKGRRGARRGKIIQLSIPGVEGPHPLEIRTSPHQGRWVARAYVRGLGGERFKKLGICFGPTEASARRSCKRMLEKAFMAAMTKAQEQRAQEAARS